MNNQEIAAGYLRCFCAGDVDGLAPLLAADLDFQGTFHTYASASEYLDSLYEDPPEPCGYEVLSMLGNGDQVAVFYEYIKPDRTIPVAQLFTIRGGRIREVLLIFDGRGFDG